MIHGTAASRGQGLRLSGVVYALLLAAVAMSLQAQLAGADCSDRTYNCIVDADVVVDRSSSSTTKVSVHELEAMLSRTQRSMICPAIHRLKEGTDPHPNLFPLLLDYT